MIVIAIESRIYDTKRIILESASSYATAIAENHRKHTRLKT